MYSAGSELDEEEEGENWSAVWQGETEASEPPYSSKSSKPRVHAEQTDPAKEEGGDNSAEGGKNEASIMSRMALNDNKAGMQGLDREKINKIIYEASKGSRFYENELKREEQVNKRIQEQQARKDKLTNADIAEGEIQADRLLAELELTRDFSHHIVHIDMDAFYAAVEMRDNPSLRDKPMAVGGVGMLSTSNYVARRYGVRAGMPGFIGKKLCPDLVIVPTNFAAYRTASSQVRAILHDYDPNFCPMSLDEAYLDLTQHVKKRKEFCEGRRTFPKRGKPEMLCQCQHAETNSLYDGQSKREVFGPEGAAVAPSIFDQEAVKRRDKDAADCSGGQAEAVCDMVECSDAQTHSAGNCAVCGKPTRPEDMQEFETFGLSVEEAVREMRFRIQHKTLLTASAGIASNTMLAKVCSDKNKPNGQYKIAPTRDAVMAFIRDLPIRKISGIGKVSEKMLRALNVTTCRQLYENRGLLYHLHSTISFNHFMRICLGIGATKVERTFRELSAPAQLYKKCYELCQSLAEDLQDEEIVGKTVTLKIKLVTFETRTRAQSLINPTNESEQIYGAARDLLRTEIQSCAPQPLKLRLMGVRMSNLLSHSQLGEQKQGTIVGLFKKHQSKEPKPPAMNPPAENIIDVAKKESKSESYTCPVCSVSFQTVDSAHRHIDDCLREQDSSWKQDESSHSEPSTGPSELEVCDSQTKTALLSDVDSPRNTRGPFPGSPKVLGNAEPCQSKPAIDPDPSCSTSESMAYTQVGPDSRSGSIFVCPVCNQEQQCKDLDSLNQHVDACLNKQTIKHIVQQQNQELKPKTAQKRFSTLESSQSTKKRKTGSNSLRTLDSFFR